MNITNTLKESANEGFESLSKMIKSDIGEDSKMLLKRIYFLGFSQGVITGSSILNSFNAKELMEGLYGKTNEFDGNNDSTRGKEQTNDL